METVCRVCEPSPDLVPREVETDRTRGIGIYYEILQIWSNQYFGILVRLHIWPIPQECHSLSPLCQVCK